MGPLLEAEGNLDAAKSYEDYRVIENLQRAGVDCFVQRTPQSTCVKLEYPTTNVDIRNLYVTSTAGSFSLA